MRCEVHCPAPGGFGVLAAVGVLGLAGLLSWVLSLGVWAAVACVILAADAAGCVVVYRLVRYGRLRKPEVAKPATSGAASGQPAPAALPAPRRAIEAPRPVVEGAVVKGEKVEA